MQNVTIYIRRYRNGKQKYHRITKDTGERPFYLRYEVNGKRRWERLASGVLDPFFTWKAAVAEAKRREADLLSGTVFPTAPAVPSKTPETLSATIKSYIGRVTEMKSERTSSGYDYTLQEFAKTCTKPVGEITKDDLQNFAIAMRKDGLSDRTISNRLTEVRTFLRASGLSEDALKKIKLRWKYTEKIVRAYRPDELTRLFAVATPEEWLLFQFFLCSGARDQEVQNATWEDIDFVDGILTIRDKDNWQIKDREEREVPLPDYLVEALKQRMLNTKGALIFPGKDGKKEGHYLRILQALAKRAGMDPANFGLHKFRKTYATLQHRAGVDARTIQRRLGHSDLATTLAYLEAEDARCAETREKVNGVFGVFA